MSAAVKMSSALAANETFNGLDSLRDELLNLPKKLRCALIVFDVHVINENVDDGERVPTVRIRKIEPIGDVDSIPDEVRVAMAKAHELRTGVSVLPLDVFSHEAGEED